MTKDSTRCLFIQEPLGLLDPAQRPLDVAKPRPVFEKELVLLQQLRGGFANAARDVTPALSEYLAALRQYEAEANKPATEEGGASGMGAAHG